MLSASPTATRDPTFIWHASCVKRFRVKQIKQKDTSALKIFGCRQGVFGNASLSNMSNIKLSRPGAQIQRPPARRTHATLLTLFAVILWGSAPIGARFLLGNVHRGLQPIPYTAVRFGIASICLLPYFFGAVKTWSHREWLRGVCCGFSGIAFANLTLALAGSTVSAGLSGLLQSTPPLMIVILMTLRTGRAPDRRVLMAAAMALAGIFVLAHAGPAQGDAKGIILCLLSALGWAVYCMLVPPLLASHGTLQVSAVATVLGTIPLLFLGLSGLGQLTAAMGPPEWIVMFALAVGTSVTAMIAWNNGVAGLGAESSSWYLNLMPIFSAGGGLLFLDEPVPLVEFVGGAILLFSVYVSQREPKRRSFSATERVSFFKCKKATRGKRYEHQNESEHRYSGHSG